MAVDTNEPGCLVLLVMLCILSVPASTNSVTPELSPALNWWEARNYCKRKYDDDLYMPTIDHPISISHPDNGTTYWVGAFETSEWRWTDNSTPFVHRGYTTSNGLSLSKVDIPGNSVEQCYRHCPRKRYIALSETGCFCLDNFQLSNSVSRGKESACPGNSGEKCGDSEGMSVYKTDILFVDNQTGHCVYSYWQKNNKTRHISFEAGGCTKQRYAICSEKDEDDFDNNDRSRCAVNESYDRCESGTCTTCDRYTWQDARNKCTLPKMSKKNKDTVFNFLSKQSTINHWTGLRRRTMQIWINGSKVNNPTRSSNHTLRCLAMSYIDNNWTTYWLPCSDDHPALCGKIYIPKLLNGLSIGVGVSVLLILLLTAFVAVVLKRQKKLCFQTPPRTAIQQTTENRTLEPVYHELELPSSYMSVNIDDQATAAHSPNQLDSAVDKAQLNITKLNLVYSHLMADGENDYDIAGRKPDIDRCVSAYDHVHAVRVDQGGGNE